MPSLAGCRPSGSKQWADLRANDGSVDSHRQGESQVQDPKENGIRDRTGDRATMSVQDPSRRQDQRQMHLQHSSDRVWAEMGPQSPWAGVRGGPGEADQGH